MIYRLLSSLYSRVYSKLLDVFVAGLFKESQESYKRKKGDILKIEDIEMVVSSKKKKRRGSERTIYRVYLEGVSNPQKKVTFTEKFDYYSHRDGEVVIMQEITYKYDGEIFSDITFAGRKHYSRLDNYCQSNPHSDIDKHIDEIDEQTDNKEKTNNDTYQTWKSQPFYIKFIFTTFLGMILFAAQILVMVLVIFL